MVKFTFCIFLKTTQNTQKQHIKNHKQLNTLKKVLLAPDFSYRFASLFRTILNNDIMKKFLFSHSPFTYLISFIILSFTIQYTYSQTFQKGYSNSKYFSIHELPSGNFIVGGTPNGSSNDSRVLLQKFTPQGNLIQSNALSPDGGLSFDETHPPHIFTQDGDSLLLSIYGSSIAGNTSIYPGLVKTDTAFNASWWKSYRNINATSGNPRGGNNESFIDANGDYVHAGWFNPAQGGTFDYFPMIQKTDNQGNEVWKYNISPLTFEFMFAACEAQNGNYIIGGGTQKARIIAITPAGTLAWAFSYDIDGNNTSEITDLISLNDGSILAIGSATSSTGTDKQGFLLKIDASGAVIWANTYGDPGEDYLYKAKPTQGGGFIACGKTTSYGAGQEDGWLLNVNSHGSLNWSYAYGVNSSDILNDVIALSDGSFIAIGASADEGWIVKTNATGSTNCHETVITPTSTDVTGTTSSSTLNVTLTNYTGVSTEITTKDTIITSAGDFSLLTDSLCEGSSYDFHGILLTESGIYYDTLEGRITCDSIVQLDLTVHPVGYVTYDTICYGETLLFNNMTLSTSGIYSTDTITSSYGCDSAQVIELTVLDSLQPDTYFSNGQLSTDAFATYQWYYEGTPAPGATGQFHTPQNNGFYQALVTNSHGCSGFSDAISVTGLTIENNNADFINVYPNPMRGNQLKIRTELPVEAITIYNTAGEVVKRTTLKNIDVSSLSKGLYVVCITTVDHRIFNKKISLLK